MFTAQFGERCAGISGSVGENRIIAKPAAHVETDWRDQQTDQEWDPPTSRSESGR